MFRYVRYVKKFIKTLTDPKQSANVYAYWIEQGIVRVGKIFASPTGDFQSADNSQLNKI